VFSLFPGALRIVVRVRHIFRITAESAQHLPPSRPLAQHGGGRRNTGAAAAVSPSAFTTSSSVSSSSSYSRNLLGGSQSQQDVWPRAAAAYSRSKEDLKQRVPDPLARPLHPGDSGGGLMVLPPAALQNLVRERLRQKGINQSQLSPIHSR